METLDKYKDYETEIGKTCLDFKKQCVSSFLTVKHIVQSGLDTFISTSLLISHSNTKCKSLYTGTDPDIGPTIAVPYFPTFY